MINFEGEVVNVSGLIMLLLFSNLGFIVFLEVAHFYVATLPLNDSVVVYKTQLGVDRMVDTMTMPLGSVCVDAKN